MQQHFTSAVSAVRRVFTAAGFSLLFTAFLCFLLTVYITFIILKPEKVFCRLEIVFGGRHNALPVIICHLSWLADCEFGPEFGPINYKSVFY